MIVIDIFKFILSNL